MFKLDFSVYGYIKRKYVKLENYKQKINCETMCEQDGTFTFFLNDKRIYSFAVNLHEREKKKFLSFVYECSKFSFESFYKFIENLTENKTAKFNFGLNVINFMYSKGKFTVLMEGEKEQNSRFEIEISSTEREQFIGEFKKFIDWCEYLASDEFYDSEFDESESESESETDEEPESEITQTVQLVELSEIE